MLLFAANNVGFIVMEIRVFREVKRVDGTGIGKVGDFSLRKK